MKFDRFLPVLAAVGLLVSLAARAEDAEKVKIAVMELRAEAGIAAGVRDLLYERLLREVEKAGQHEVLGRTDIESMLGLEADRQKLGCFDDSSCIAEIGGALGVRYMLTGNLGRIGESLLFNIKRIDVNQAKAVGRVSRRIKGGTDEQLLDALPSIVAELFGQEQVEAASAGTEEPKGELTAEVPPPGGSKDEASSESGGASAQRIAGWVVLGVGAAALAAGAGLGGYALAQQSSLGESKFDEDTYDDTLSTIDSSALAADVLLAVGGAAALTGLLLVLLDGGGNDGPSQAEPATAGVTLQAGPCGVSLKGRF